MYDTTQITFFEIINTFSKKDKDLMDQVYRFTESAHSGQKRKSGEPYFLHPLNVGIHLWEKFHDINLFAAGLLHDTVEDCPEVEMSYIYDTYGPEIWYIVDASSKNLPQFYRSEQVFDRKIDKLIYGGMQNVKCFLLKIADRNDNLQTLQNLKDNKQVRIAFETQAIFTPLETVLDYKNSSCVDQAHKYFTNTLSTNNISDYLDFKNYLTQKTFKNFSNDSFDAVYQHSSNVSWKITNKETFKNLIEIPDIDDKINTEAIQIDEFWRFLAIITFKKGKIITNIPLEIGDQFNFNNT